MEVGVDTFPLWIFFGSSLLNQHRQQGFARSCFHEGGPHCNKRHIQWQCSYKAFLYGEEILDNLHFIRFIFLFIERTKIRYVILDIMLFSKTKWSLQEWKLGKGSVKQIGLFQVGRNFFLSLFSLSHLLITSKGDQKLTSIFDWLALAFLWASFGRKLFTFIPFHHSNYSWQGKISDNISKEWMLQDFSLIKLLISALSCPVSIG